MPTPPIIYRKTRPPGPFAHGGTHRALQLVEIMTGAGFKVIDLPAPTSEPGRFARLMAGWNLVRQQSFRQNLSRKQVAYAGYHYLQTQQVLAQCSDSKILLWEFSNYSVVPYVAKQMGFTVIATPQNLESLVETQTDAYSGQAAPQFLLDEIRDLGQADSIFCISREEQWLLRNFQLNSHYLPYHPPHALRSRLSAIRAQRSATPQRGRFLILGSASNPPTRSGMLELGHWLQQLPGEVEFDVVGAETDKLGGPFKAPKFKLHGRLDDSALDSLLLSTKAVMLHQVRGAGALTRIAEMLSAGIPVLANNIAARSAHEHEGVHVYSCPDELAKLLSATLPQPGAPKPPANAEAQFIQALR
jgi:hypothetical protein